ncbi:hypothetical protein NECAME_04129 [Necator americanus]|uniref:Uncharacterized protein n=1 Tax=Necator americanus TaxID=51031 RepID=W2SWT7_NECAM|nr:hypothetical protein NECAME_04129 [Necator americanus]ETN74100.1 hypothetical protein NECAME_04129 [Necator americanus]
MDENELERVEDLYDKPGRRCRRDLLTYTCPSLMAGIMRNRVEVEWEERPARTTRSIGCLNTLSQPL